MNPEQIRLIEDARREKNWKRWGPYLSERQWGTVREDYSASGDCWSYFPHDHARSRAYRWGEDGLLGICDRQGRLCFALALWNGQDKIMKERLFGLGTKEGNHGEDVKECYFYQDSTPTHSYMKALYKYPQRAFPYDELREQNQQRSRLDPEFELIDTGIFSEGRYFDVQIEYAKVAASDILIRIRATNRGPETCPLHILPTIWFRNTWAWGRSGEGYDARPVISAAGTSVQCEHQTLGTYSLEAITHAAEWLFTGNETDFARLDCGSNTTSYVKNAFHRYVIGHDPAAVNPAGSGTKAAALYRNDIAPGATVELRLRLRAASETNTVTSDAFDAMFAQRIAEADLFHGFSNEPGAQPTQPMLVAREAEANLMWSKQFYNFGVLEWMQGDPVYPNPPATRWTGRNSGWQHLYNRDVISMPDNWEFPWYASWDLAFHMVAFAEVDPYFAKEQLVLLLREWYMHPSGQIPAYEFEFGDVNPPVHAWAAWRVYKISAPPGQRDRAFLERVFQKLLINFTWWANRKDVEGSHIFSGGFLGLDNIGVFDRSKPIEGGVLEQADGSAWMAFYCLTMLAIALELAQEDAVYEDVASKFFEHFIAIADAINTVGGTGLWDEEDGFYYDQLRACDITTPMKVRSMVGLIPLIAVEVLEQEAIDKLPGFKKRMDWFLTNRSDLYRQISLMETSNAKTDSGLHEHRLLGIPTKSRLRRVLCRLLDETEFLSPYGIRSLSAQHREKPYVLRVDGQEWRVEYEPGESQTALFGGNSNWRGPVWFPMNYLLMESLERYHHFYGAEFTIECPTGSGTMLTLREVAREINRRLCAIFTADTAGRSPWQGDTKIFSEDPHWRGQTWFHEYFHGDTGRGCGASHQTGWTALIARCLRDREASEIAAAISSDSRTSKAPTPRPE
jgi:Glycosyl hydrolase family 63 C-terminal domain